MPKKVGRKKRQKRQQKKAAKKPQEKWEKSLFLNLSCWCLETGLKPVLLIITFVKTEFIKFLNRYFC